MHLKTASARAACCCAVQHTPEQPKRQLTQGRKQAVLQQSLGKALDKAMQQRLKPAHQYASCQCACASSYLHYAEWCAAVDAAVMLAQLQHVVGQGSAIPWRKHLNRRKPVNLQHSTAHYSMSAMHTAASTENPAGVLIQRLLLRLARAEQ